MGNGVEAGQKVIIDNVNDSTVVVNGKPNVVAIMNCKNTQVVMESVVAAVEVTNCQKVKFQITGSCPAAAIDKTDSCMIYMMSEDAKKMQISTSKHSDVQVTYIAGDEGVEKPIPEQFTHVLDGDNVRSSVSSI